MKYETKDDVSPAAERIDSMSCIVNKNMICPDDKERMSLARSAMCVVRLDLCFEMIWTRVSLKRLGGKQHIQYARNLGG